MIGESNPFDPPKDQPIFDDRSAEPASRGTAFLISIISFAGFGIVGFQLLVIYGFSTIVDPSLPDADRRQFAAKQFLFGNGPFQIAFVSAFAAITFIAFVSALTHLSSAVFRRPSLRVAKIVSIGCGLILTAGLIGFFLVRTF